jgi:hypothetical protein
MGSESKTLLKLLVDQQRMSYAGFERRFNETSRRVLGKGANNPTCGETQFRRWTGGKLKGLPGPETCRVLEAMFPGYAVAELFAPPPSADDPQAPAYNLEEQIRMTAREAHEGADVTASASISDTTVDELRDQVVNLAREYYGIPPLRAFTEANRLRQEAERQRDRTQVPIQQQELMVLTGQAAALLAAAAFDLGYLADARSFARTAALYGETTRFTPLQAFADGVLAYTAYFRGETTEAVRKAKGALSYGGIGDVATRRLLTIQGRSFAHLGDIESARHAIQLSEQTETGSRDALHDDVGGEFGFTQERLAMSNSSTRLLIGDGRQAEAAALHALELLGQKPQDNRSPHVLGSAAADLALARLMNNDVEGAAEALDPVWDIPGPQRMTGVLVRTARVRRHLSQPAYHGAQLPQELRERIEDFTVASEPYRLGLRTGLLELEA